MAFSFQNYVCFTDEKDFNAKVKQVLRNQLRYDGGIIRKPIQFPALFVYSASFDVRSCGSWELCENFLPMLEAIEAEQKRLTSLQEKILNLA